MDCKYSTQKPILQAISPDFSDTNKLKALITIQIAS